MKNKIFMLIIGFLVLLILYFLIIPNRNLIKQEKGIEEKQVSTREIIKSVFEKGLQKTNLDSYTGTLMMHGISEFALLYGSDTLMDRIIDIYKKFGAGEIKATGNFISYEAGGSGAAYLVWKEVANVLDKQVAVAADKMMKQQKRSPEGLMTAKSAKDDQVFIDVAFAVSPYLLYSGLKFGNKEYIDFAVFETLELFSILKDKNTGLVHQARGYNGFGNLTEDNWSRGNGWAAFAISILIRDLPDSHPKRKELVKTARDFFNSVIRYQNKVGLWHQEMTDTTSYIETSGSGLLLYGLGIMLEKGLLPNKYLGNFKKGLQGLTSYIGSDGSVSHTCSGCLCPGKGTKGDYKNHPWIYNDPHAFGPVILAFSQATKLGIDKVKPLKKLGYYTIIDSPEVPRTYVTSARGGKDIAWENDRIAFRVFGPTVRDKVGSGIDVWVKSVNYPILDKWYKLEEQGKSYHIDCGEGLDFYDMKKGRGCGGLAIWVEGKPFPSETYDSFRIIQNQDDKIVFGLDYKTWDVPGLTIEERKLIEMELGTNLFKVTSTIQNESNVELTVAIGLSTFGKSEVLRDKETGILSVWEQIGDQSNGSLGSAVLINKENFAGFASFSENEFVLMNVQTNVPFIYYAGAGWSKSGIFNTKYDWFDYLKTEAKRAKF
ncbi:MAG TPA: DUF4861 family protein [Sedimentibacter sp.]|nr:DUF4861 family protein [Sedimentibacter sp.]